MGSGKSAATAIFSSLGVNVIDADALAKSILNDDIQVKLKVVELLGNDAYQNGKLNSSYIASKVFADKNLLQKYEEIIHPKTKALWKSKMLAGINLVEIPLLFEKYESLVAGSNLDVICSLYTSPKIRFERLIARGMSESQIKMRDANQMSPEEKMKRAQVVFFNDGSKDFLKKQIEIFLKRII